jgi:hypothetical protein
VPGAAWLAEVERAYGGPIFVIEISGSTIRLLDWTRRFDPFSEKHITSAWEPVLR